MINASEYMPKIPRLQLPLDQITEAGKTHPPLITFRLLNPHQDSPALFGIHSPAPKPLHAFPSPFIEVQSFSHSSFPQGPALSFFQEGQPPIITYVVIVLIRHHHLSVLPLTINQYSYFYLYHTSPYHHVLFIPPPGSFPPSFTFREYRY